jgi:hypothetical protein
MDDDLGASCERDLLVSRGFLRSTQKLGWWFSGFGRCDFIKRITSKQTQERQQQENQLLEKQRQESKQAVH